MSLRLFSISSSAPGRTSPETPVAEFLRLEFETQTIDLGLVTQLPKKASVRLGVCKQQTEQKKLPRAMNCYRYP